LVLGAPVPEPDAIVLVVKSFHEKAG